MSESTLKLLLNTRKEYGLRREVDPPVVLSGFLNRAWSERNPRKKDAISQFLLDESNDENIALKVSGSGNKEEKIGILQNFLKQILWTNPEAFEKRIKKKKITGIENDKQDEKEQKKLLDSITYNPFNRSFMGDIREDLEIGQTLYDCLNDALKNDPEKLDKIRDRLGFLERHQEVEESFLETLFPTPGSSDKEESTPPRTPGPGIEPPIRAGEYASLFRQLGDDLDALLELDVHLLSKSRVLLYLEKITNLYVFLYYLRIICKKTDLQLGISHNPPLILPLCSDELEDRYKEYSDACLQFYRQQSEEFWRSYLHERVDYNAHQLLCAGKSANDILEEFKKNVKGIFGSTGTTGSLEDEIKDNLLQLQKSSHLSHVSKFTEAFLLYNLKGQRTLARIKRILEWQGAGAGIVAPEKGKGKHFHLKPELLEILVIIFYSHSSHQQDLSLQNFINEVRKRYGIVLGPSEDIEAALKEQGLKVPAPSLLKKNFGHLLSMLTNLNMLERLSDKAMFIKCPFQLQKED